MLAPHLPRFLCGSLFFLLACGQVSPTADPHESHTQYVCNTPDDETAEADVTIDASLGTVSPDGRFRMAVSTFDGDVPGPVIEFVVGQTRRIKLRNHTDAPIGLHFLGLSYPVEEDGTHLYPHSIVNPGCAHVYPVTAKAPGVFPFVDHLQPIQGLSLGQYGVSIVRSPTEDPVDKEYVLFMGELGKETSGSHEEEEAQGGERRFFMTFNGRTDASPLAIEQRAKQSIRSAGWPSSLVGDRVRLRLVNVSPSVFHSFGIHGYNFCDRGGVISDTGACPNGGRTQNIVTMSPLEGTTLELRTTSKGRWMYHCHILEHVEEGMLGYFDVN